MIDNGPRAVLSRCEGIQLPDGVGDVGDTRFPAACLLLHSGHVGAGCRVSVTASSTRDPSSLGERITCRFAISPASVWSLRKKSDIFKFVTNGESRV